MFSYIEGKIVEKNPAFAVIDVSGIGYGLNISLNTYSKLENQTNIKLLTHVAFKVEATNPVGIEIFGFIDEEERTLFRYLIGVSRVGMNTAMVMLSSLRPQEIYKAIANEDYKTLQSIKGIGAKAAQRIVMELKDKVGKAFKDTDKLVEAYNLNKEEALSGLVMLGFDKARANKSLDKIIGRKNGDTLTVEELIKEALKIL
ncbi:MAG: Holliday junction branch migration protein RuvA [Bacteroidales bacterium]|nr:Holliday junction branch migration protein RuvA [Bacteroidales bacterium]MCF8338219.1 Holliday junction branch migration protein RuvA [Bacteroidales bacterium]